MTDSDVELLVRDKLNVHASFDKRVLKFLIDMSEGNPAIIIELCQSILESGVVEITGQSLTKVRGKHLKEIQLNARLRHMALQEFSERHLHEQLISKMVSSKRLESGGFGGGGGGREGHALA